MDELTGTAPAVEAPPAPTEPAQVVATAPIPEGTVDTAPDPAILKAEIEKLELARKEAEEKALYWRRQKTEARADYFKGGREEHPPQSAPPAQDLGIGPEPRQDAFDDYQKYLDAKIGYEVNKAKTTWDRDQARKNEDQQRQQKFVNLQERINEGYKQFPDFEEVALDRTVPITPMITEILADTDRPAELAYYLGKNRAEAIQISRMTPIQAARALAKIETKMAESGVPPPSNPKLPGAPPPIKPLGSSHTVTRSLEKMTQKEFEAEMERRTGRRF